MGADLGTALKPGCNRIVGNAFSGVLVVLRDGRAVPQDVNAAGNTSTPPTRGSDAIGLYALGTVVGPTSSLAHGKKSELRAHGVSTSDASVDATRYAASAAPRSTSGVDVPHTELASVPPSASRSASDES